MDKEQDLYYFGDENKNELYFFTKNQFSEYEIEKYCELFDLIRVSKRNVEGLVTDNFIFRKKSELEVFKTDSDSLNLESFRDVIKMHCKIDVIKYDFHLMMKFSSYDVINFFRSGFYGRMSLPLF